MFGFRRDTERALKCEDILRDKLKQKKTKEKYERIWNTIVKHIKDFKNQPCGSITDKDSVVNFIGRILVSVFVFPVICTKRNNRDTF